MDNIPNSKNIPYSNLFDKSTGLLKSKDELLRSKNFQNLNIYVTIFL
jgi:3-mercaptopyruvate sulfurtransferase SseA